MVKKRIYPFNTEKTVYFVNFRTCSSYVIKFNTASSLLSIFGDFPPPKLRRKKYPKKWNCFFGLEN